MTKQKWNDLFIDCFLVFKWGFNLKTKFYSSNSLTEKLKWNLI